jgi:hypothetical protein
LSSFSERKPPAESDLDFLEGGPPSSVSSSSLSSSNELEI